MAATADQIVQALNAVSRLPVPVSDWLVETGTDWIDDPAIWVWGVLSDPDIDAATQSALRKAIREAVRKRAGDGSTIYIRFRALADSAEAR